MSPDTHPAEGTAQTAVNEAEWANRANWRLGLFYVSPRDSRIWVPKRTIFGRKHRLGLTPNFSRRGARLYMGLLGSMALGTIVALLVLKGLGAV
ncbi:MAG TPA: hypothetical protein VF678_08835 [bacterium]